MPCIVSFHQTDIWVQNVCRGWGGHKNPPTWRGPLGSFLSVGDPTFYDHFKVSYIDKFS